MAGKGKSSIATKAGMENYAAELVNADVESANKAFGGDNPEIAVSQDAYGRWILSTGQGRDAVPIYIYVDPSEPTKWSRASSVEIVRQIKKDYANNLEGLRKVLFDKGFLTKDEYNTRDEAAFNNRILEAVTSHSIEQVQKFTIEGKTVFTSFNSWLKNKAVSGKGTQPSQERQLTDKLNAGQELDNFVMQMLGRKATADEKKLYFEKLSAEEKKAIKKTTVSGDIATTTGEFINTLDAYRIMADVIKPSIKNTPLEDISKFGGRVAQNIVKLRETAADYGINLSTKDALDRIMRTFDTGGVLDTNVLDGEESLIRETSKAFYGKLAPLIDQGVKVSDISKQFAKYKSDTLEIPEDSISIFDEDIQQALRNDGRDGVMTLTDYKRLLRTNPKTKSIWLKTKNAREEAANYASDILKAFGLMA